MAVTVERLHALFILAWALVKTLAAPIFGARRGLEAFRASYALDRLPAMDEDGRKHLPTFSGCIACGRCDVGEAARIVASKGAFRGVMDLVLASSRNIPDFDAAARSFELITDADLAKIEPVCPVAVPMREIRRFVLAKAQHLDDDRRSVTP